MDISGRWLWLADAVRSPGRADGSGWPERLRPTAEVSRRSPKLQVPGSRVEGGECLGWYECSMSRSGTSSQASVADWSSCPWHH